MTIEEAAIAPTIVSAVFDSPVGPLYARVEGDVLTRFGFARRARAFTPDEVVFASAPLRALWAQVREYFDGARRQFDLRLRMDGPEFHRRVWAALCDIPYGETISYGQLAKNIGDPEAARAVGAANGANPIAIIVPCHRVIGADGSLVGYGGGLDRKRKLLDLESGKISLHF